LKSNKIIQSIIGGLAAFGAYFCMYAFRKPFSAATYDNTAIYGLGLKTLLVIFQVIGYMISKFIGVKILSEMKPNQRIAYFIGLLIVAEFGLLLFGLFPVKIKPIALLINGLPLGMIWGIVFSYLEGKKYTDFMAAILSVSFIIASGALKSIGRFFLYNLNISEYWMPSVIGVVFFPLSILFIAILSNIPPPDADDILIKTERKSLNHQQRRSLFMTFAPGLICLIFSYVLLTILRDYRDNFSIEIVKDLIPNFNPNIFAKVEITIGIIVLILVSLLVLVKNNMKVFRISLLAIAFSFIITLGAEYLFGLKLLSPIQWMFLSGLGLFLGYIPFNSSLFDRFIGAYKIQGNVNFLMYLCDSIGYLASVFLLLSKEIFLKGVTFSSFYRDVLVFGSLVGLLFGIGSFIYFNFKRKGAPTINNN